MKIYKIIAYLYLAFALVFAYDTFVRFQNGESYILSILLFAAALFMFFFRLKNAKKFENNQK